MAFDNEDFVALRQEFATATDKVKEIAENFNGKMAHFEKISASEKEKADELLIKMNELGAKFSELEQKYDRIGTVETKEAVSEKSAGVQFADFVKDAPKLQSQKDKIELQCKDITTATAGAVLRDLRIDGIQAPATRTDMLDLIGVSQISESSITFVQETGFTNNAAVVPEGELKPQSDLTFDSVTLPLYTIAHWVLISRQMFEDSNPEGLINHINNRLVYGLRLEFERKILNGTGGTNQFNGLLNQAQAFSNSTNIATADLTAIDTIRLAILQTTLSGYYADGVVLHPTNWTEIELAKNDIGGYVIGNPVGTTDRRMWGLPVAETQGITNNNFLVGAFRTAAQIFRKGGMRIEAGFEDRDNFVKNMVTILAEERANLAVYRPEAFIKGTFA